MADGILGTIGDLASPLQGALDFVAPQPEQYGGGLDLGSLMSSIGRGARNTFTEGLPGVAGAAVAALNPNSQMGLRDRLLIGGVALGAGGMMAREAHRAWKARIDPLSIPSVRQAPSGYQELVTDLGSRPRGIDRLTPAGEVHFLETPGVRPQTSNLLGAQDETQLLDAVRGWDPLDLDAEGSAQQILSNYQLRVGGLDQAQFDLARFDSVHAGHRVLQGDRTTLNGQVRNLWDRFTTAPQSLEREEAEQLMGAIEAVARATELADIDLSIGPVGRISRVDLTDDGNAIATVSYPKNWNDGMVTDPLVRAARFKALNHRQFSQIGERNIEYLFRMGKEYFDTGSTRYGSRMDLGPDWYKTARTDVAREFQLPDEPSPELERAVAAVSFLSEAEDWATNIPKARKILESPRVAAGLHDPEFLAWLRDPSSFDPAATKRHQAALNDIHSYFQDASNFADGKAFKISQADLKVILRLTGGDETVRAIFASTKREKQKNFFLNIYDPDLQYPTTIDRHAYDVYFGIDTGIQDRPVSDTSYDGEFNYDIIADTYRRVANRLGYTPHQVQAVTWEMWRILKQERFEKITKEGVSSVKSTGGWKRFDPFRLPAFDDQLRPLGENVAFEVVNGRGFDVMPNISIGAPSSTLPVQTLRTPVPTQLSTSILPDGSVVHSTSVDEFAALELRHLTPVVNGSDGTARWILSEPQRVTSTETVRSATRADARAYGESYLKTSMDGPHPLVDPEESFTFELPSGRVPSVTGLIIEDMGPITVDRPNRVLEKVTPDNIDPHNFVDPENGYLATHQWTSLTAALPESMTPDEISTAMNRLRVELEDRGYAVFEQRGHYGGYDEPSFLVFGMEPTEALELGEKYGQDSVLTSQGFLFSRKGWEVPDAGFDLPEKLYGAGDVDAMFNEGLTTPTPWPSANLRKGNRIQGLIDSAIDNPEMAQVDPRYLYANQPNVTRHGVKRYIDDPAAAPIDSDPGNRVPIVYETRDGKRVLLSGHHRAAAALVEGRPLEVSLVREPQYYPSTRYRMVNDLTGDGSFTKIGDTEYGWEAIDTPDWGRLAEETAPFDPKDLLKSETTTVRRYRAKIAPESGKDIITAADEMELTHGARNLSVYANRHDVDSEWDVVYEHLFDDGVNVYSARTKTGAITSANSGPVLVRSGTIVPESLPELSTVVSPTRPGTSLNYGPIVVQGRGEFLRPGDDLFGMMNRNDEKFTGFAVTPDGYVPYIGEPPTDALATFRRPRSKTIQIEALDPSDISPAIRAKQALEAMGFQDFKVVADGDELSFPSRTDYRHEELVYFRDGTVAPRAPRDHPLQWFSDKHGFILDAGYRVGNRIEMLADDVTQSVDDVITRFEESGFGEAFKRWRPSKIKVRDLKGAYGEMAWQPGTPVFLDRGWWHNQDALREALELDRTTGRLARRASTEPVSIVSHEMGHVVHGAVLLSQNFPSGEGPIDQLLKDLVLSHGGGKSWRDIASKNISKQAAENTSELVAEAFSEVFTPGPQGPSEMSRKVVDLMREEVSKVNRYRTKGVA